MNKFHVFVNRLFVVLVVLLVCAALYVTTGLIQESWNNYFEPPAVATVRAATPTTTPEYVNIRVIKLHTSKSSSGSESHWIVSDDENVYYVATMQAWLIIEPGKCYRVLLQEKYLASDTGTIIQAKSTPCEE